MKLRRTLVCAALCLGLAACKAQAPAAGAAQVTARTDQEKILYAVGLVMGQRLDTFALTPEEWAVVRQGMTDHLTHARLQVDLQEWGPRIGEFAQGRSRVRGERERTRGAEFAALAAAEPNARRLPSGLIYRELQAGTGEQPTPTSAVRVHYRGKLVDGTVFDSSFGANGLGQPAQFRLDEVVPCWTQGVTQMRVGGKARLVCPSELGYGERGTGGIPPGATLDFEVELVSIVNMASQIAPPLGPTTADAGPPVPSSAPPSAPAPH